MTSKYSDKFILSLEFLNVVLQWRMNAVSSIKFLKMTVKIATKPYIALVFDMLKC
jgi:hypothetical protein